MYNDYDLMNVDKRYPTPTIEFYQDDNSIRMVKTTPQKRIRINFSAGTVGIIVLMMINAFNLNTDRYVDQSNSFVTDTVVEKNSVQYESSDIQRERETNQENGYTGAFESHEEVFPDSSERYLTDEEIASLGGSNQPVKLQLIQQSLNEIFARHGYEFRMKAWRDYYCQFSWYQNKGLNDAETRKRFNAIERANVEKLETVRNKLNGQ